MNFEESMETLEKIVKGLESGDLPIEKSIEEFEKGIKLVKECQKKLEKAQLQVKKLMSETDDEENN